MSARNGAQSAGNEAVDLEAFARRLAIVQFKIKYMTIPRTDPAVSEIVTFG